MKFLAYCFNFRAWRWGKAGSLTVGLLITTAYIAMGVMLPGWWKALGWVFLVAAYRSHWLNFKGKQS